MVLTQAREELIKRTVESLVGARRAIVHVYNATAPVWRKVVFSMTSQEVMQLVDRSVRYIKQLTDQHPETEWVLEYSPETFQHDGAGCRARGVPHGDGGVGSRARAARSSSTCRRRWRTRRPMCSRTRSSGCTRICKSA